MHLSLQNSKLGKLLSSLKVYTTFGIRTHCVKVHKVFHLHFLWWEGSRTQDLCSNHLLYALQLLISCFTRNLLITHGISGVGRGSYGSLAATMSRCRLSRTTEDIKHRVQAIRINLSQRMALMGEVWWCDDCFHSFGPKICGSLIASTYQAMTQTPTFFTDLSHWTGAKMVFPFRTSLEFVPRLIQVENSSGKLVWSSNRRTFQLARSCSVVGKNSVLKLSILNKLHVAYMRILKHLRLKRRKTSFHHLNCEVSNPWFQGLLLFDAFCRLSKKRTTQTTNDRDTKRPWRRWRHP